MSRLIDADVLCEKIRKTYNGYMLDECGCTPIDFENMVDDMPTAFDTEKVVEQLLDMRLIRVEQCHGDYEIEVMTESNFDDAIDIVKKGGV